MILGTMPSKVDHIFSLNYWGSLYRNVSPLRQIMITREEAILHKKMIISVKK